MNWLSTIVLAVFGTAFVLFLAIAPYAEDIYWHFWYQKQKKVNK